MKENNRNTKWKGAIVRHLEALKFQQGNFPSAISQVYVDKANSISMEICLFMSLPLHLYLPFPLIFLSFFAHVKVILFYVFLQPLNHGGRVPRYILVSTLNIFELKPTVYHVCIATECQVMWTRRNPFAFVEANGDAKKNVKENSTTTAWL